MSHDPIVCRDCGESYDPNGSEHDCPGTPRDQMERIDQLERDLVALEREHNSLLLAIARSSDFDQLREAVLTLTRDV